MRTLDAAAFTGFVGTLTVVRAIVIVAGLLAASVLVLAIRGQRGTSDLAGVGTPSRGAEQVVLAQPDPEPEPRELPATEPNRTGPTPAVAFLESFWGQQWPEVRAKLATSGKQIEGRRPPTKSWEEAALEIEKRLPLNEGQRKEYRNNLLRWEGVVDDQWVHQQFDRGFVLDELQRATVHDIVVRHNAGAEPLVEEFLRGLDREARAAWDAGRWIHAPFTTTGAPGSERQGFFTKADGQFGWATGFVLTWEDCPDLRALHDAIQAVGAARDREALEFLRKQ